MRKKVIRVEQKDNQIIVNADVMTEIMDCTPQMLTALKKEDILVQPKYGSYDLVVSLRNYLKKLKNKASAQTVEGVLDFHEEKARLTKMQADKAEMEVMEMSGELVRVEDVLSDWQSILMDCKGKLLAIPSKVATLVADMDDPAEAQQLVDEHIREALEELADYEFIRQRQRDPDERNGGSQTSAKADDL